VIDPAHLSVNRTPPPVVIEEALADNQPIRLEGGDRLRPGRSRFEFRYTALSLRAPEKTAFRFKLEGFDHDWIEAAGRRSASYTNLPSGPYRFRVVASNEDGIWNDRGASVVFSIAPHFYETPWFFLLCAAGLGLVAEVAVVTRTRRFKARQKELEDLVAERTRQLEDANRGLERLSLLDPLTGIANRRQFERVLEFERKRSDRTGASLALLMIDIDNFKAFNDAYGHLAGDACLKGVVEALAGSMRGAGDLLARYGGEEFAVVLPAATLEGARILAERLRVRVEELRIAGATDAEEERRVTISIGVAATMETRDVSAEQLIAAADHALYEAKQQGRNRVAVASV
jgi:diguanylate cyclase (GGDEF)-like protein